MTNRNWWWFLIVVFPMGNGYAMSNYSLKPTVKSDLSGQHSRTTMKNCLIIKEKIGIFSQTLVCIIQTNSCKLVENLMAFPQCVAKQIIQEYISHTQLEMFPCKVLSIVYWKFWLFLMVTFCMDFMPKPIVKMIRKWASLHLLLHNQPTVVTPPRIKDGNHWK